MRQQERMSDSKRTPDVAQETPNDIDVQVCATIAAGLTEQYKAELGDDERFTILAKEGKDAAYLRAWVGDERHIVEFELFVRGVAGEGLEGALGPAVDFLDGVLAEFFEEQRDASLPLDFVGHPYDDTVVFARQEKRDLLAEAEAEKWLNAEEV